MTREEAVKVIENRDSIMDYCESAQLGEALEMAIKALEQEPCEDCISRADTIEWLKRVTVTDGIAFETGFKQILTDIQNMPSVTPKQKMGRWIKVITDLDGSGDKTWYYKCSICGSDDSCWGYYKYCPHCGTKMSNILTGSSCTECVLDGTDACSRGAGRAVDGRVCYDYVGKSEEEIGPNKKG